MKERLCAIAGFVLFGSSVCHANVITHQQLVSGQSNMLLSANDSIVTVNAAGGNFESKTVAGFAATGLSGGNVNGEIDGQQALTFLFAQPVSVSSLTIAFLFTAGHHGDLSNEVALFSTDRGWFTLEAAGATSGDWTGSGTVINLSPAIEGGGGIWMIAGNDIFGGPITSLTLSSGNPGSHSSFGDFSFHSMTLAAIPAPGAVALLAGAALIGCLRRR